jgi:hypothetical protein
MVNWRSGGTIGYTFLTKSLRGKRRVWKGGERSISDLKTGEKLAGNGGRWKV